MDRRWILRVLGAATVALPIVDRQASAAFEKSPEKNHKLALHVDVNDPEVMKLALNNARNAHELYTEWGEKVAIEIVAYSQGFHMLRADTSPVKEEIKALRAKVPQIEFGACNNTKMGMEKREGKTITLIPEATLVPAGIVRLVETAGARLQIRQAVSSARRKASSPDNRLPLFRVRERRKSDAGLLRSRRGPAAALQSPDLGADRSERPVFAPFRIDAVRIGT